MSSEYLLLLNPKNVDQEAFEVASQLVFDNRKNIVNGDGTQRYTDGYVKKDGASIQIMMDSLNPRTLQMVSQFCGISTVQRVQINETPRYLYVKKRGGKMSLLDTEEGKIWK